MLFAAVLDLESGRVVACADHSGATSAAAEQSAIGTECLLRLWDFDTGELIAEGLGHSSAIRSLAFSPDGRQVVSVGDDRAALIWNIYYMDQGGAAALGEPEPAPGAAP